MIRTKVIHQVTTESYDAALVEAYEWVREQGGTLIFDIPSRRKKAAGVIANSTGRETIKSDLNSNRVSIGVARGEDYLLQGPRIATFDCTDTDMKRIEAELINQYDDENVLELRSFTKTVDTHPNWTKTYEPETIG